MMADWRMECHACKKQSSVLQRCKGCFKVNYCSKACQTTDWKTHQLTCVFKATKSKTGTNHIFEANTQHFDAVIDGGINSENEDTDIPNDDENKIKLGNRCTFCQLTCATLSRCSRCLSVTYCSKQCQRKDWSSHKINCMVADWRMECHACKKESSALRRCTGCLNVYYCSKVCQTTNWKTHKQSCIHKTTQPKSDSNYTKGNKQQLGADIDIGKTVGNEDIDTHKAEEKCDGKSTKPTNKCVYCNGVDGTLLKCARCKNVTYCSKQCQIKDWSSHKINCIKEANEETYSTEERKIIDDRLRRKRNQKAADATFDSNYGYVSYFNNFIGGDSRFFATLTPAQCLINESPPDGSFLKASARARELFPNYHIIDDFRELPNEAVFPFFAGFRRQQFIVVVAFMNKYHEHVMRHGVYLLDNNNDSSKVEFYLDDFGDNPFPYFRYKDIRPGHFICIKHPVRHWFGDGTVGIRVNNPDEIRVLNIYSLG